MTLPLATPGYDRFDQDRTRTQTADRLRTLETAAPKAFISADRGDANVTLTKDDREIQRFATALSANRTVTLPTGFDGAKYTVVRTGLGAFTLDVGGLKTIGSATAAFVDVGHDGTAWRLLRYGTL